MWKTTDIVAFSSTKPYAAKYSPFKTLHSTHNYVYEDVYIDYQELVLLKFKSILASHPT